MDRAEKMREAFGEFERVYGLVAQAAARVVRTVELPGWMEFEDVVQEGLRMACEAVGRWDPGRGRFTTYLYSRFGLYLRKVVVIKPLMKPSARPARSTAGMAAMGSHPQLTSA